MLRIPNIKDGEIDISDLKFSNLDKNEFEKLKLKNNDILIIRSNGSLSLVGQSAIVRIEQEGFAYAGYLIRLRTKKELLPEYLNFIFKSDFLRLQITQKAHSTSGVNNINTNEIGELKIPLPPLEEQQQIVSTVEALFATADAIEGQYRSLKQKINKLPQALLAKAFRGELTEQHAHDEPAAALLQRIRNAKALAKTGSKPYQLFSDDNAGSRVAEE